jgi:integrase
VPIASVLHHHLAAQRLLTGGQGLVFRHPDGGPLKPDRLVERARRAWAKAGLSPILLHECRHSFASLMIAAGVNPKALSTYLGHASISITLDRYGHLMPGAEAEAAVRLDSYLEAAGVS